METSREYKKFKYLECDPIVLSLAVSLKRVFIKIVSSVFFLQTSIHLGCRKLPRSSCMYGYSNKEKRWSFTIHRPILVKLEFLHELYIHAFSVAGIRVGFSWKFNKRSVDKERKEKRKRELFQSIEYTFTLELLYVRGWHNLSIILHRSQD